MWSCILVCRLPFEIVYQDTIHPPKIWRIEVREALVFNQNTYPTFDLVAESAQVVGLSTFSKCCQRTVMYNCWLYINMYDDAHISVYVAGLGADHLGEAAAAPRAARLAAQRSGRQALLKLDRVCK